MERAAVIRAVMASPLSDDSAGVFAVHATPTCMSVAGDVHAHCLCPALDIIPSRLSALAEHCRLLV